MHIQILLHGCLACSLEADPRQAPALRAKGQALPWLSAGWRGDEPLANIRRWLFGLLPENGTLAAWEGGVDSLLRAAGIHEVPHDPETTLWVYRHTEFAGAVQMRREDEPSTAPQSIPDAYAPISESDLAKRLDLAVSTALTLKGAPDSQLGAVRASLSGMRPKISLTALDDDPDRGWLQGGHGQLNTWVVKVEHSANSPGEAGIESICQRTLCLAGIPAAKTLARRFGRWQCVLSERSDRRIENNKVIAIHQEDFRQASDSGRTKFNMGFRNEPQWPDAVRLLGDEEQARALTRFLAASVMLCHSDLHRGNLGFLISAPEMGAKRVRLAPAYDVSSAVGTDCPKYLAFGIAGQRAPHKIGARQWEAHAERSGLPPETTVDDALAVAQTLPDALSQAIREARLDDENIEQGAVNRRAERIQTYIAARAADFHRTLNKRRYRTGQDRQKNSECGPRP